MSLISPKVRRAVLGAAAAGLLLATAACGSSSSNASSGGGKTLTLWTNATTGPGTKFFQDTIDAFDKAHPGTKIKMQIVQDADLDGKLQSALQAGQGTAPDIYFQRGGGKLAAQVAAGQVAEYTPDATTKANIPASLWNTETDNGKIYAQPVDSLPGGIWYSKDLFQQAGITTPPTTIDELDADVSKLKAKGITPVALGAKDSWPAGHWYYWFALRECSQQTLNDTAKSLKFTDPCWTKAGDDLKAFAATKPFEDGFLGVVGQKGAGSSAGLLANHKAAMELMGSWEPGVVGGLTPDKKNLPDLGFFPFPSVPGGQGDQNAIMGGGDGYSCSKWAPEPTCSEFLNYLATTPVQKAYGTAFVTAPANSQAQSVVTDPALQASVKAANAAPYESLWLDTLYGSNVGTALNGAVVNLLAGKGSVSDIISAVNAAAAKG